MTTETLIQLAQQGDRSALTTLLLEHRGLIAAVVCRFITDTEHRKDVIQNVFVKVIKHIDQFAGLCRFSTWLYRLTLNECIEHGRAASRTNQRTEPLLENSAGSISLNAPDPFVSAASSELRSAIGGVLKTLPLDQKTAFSLFYFGSYSGKEGCEAMNISEANFFMKLKAGRDAVKKYLLSRGWTL